MKKALNKSEIRNQYSKAKKQYNELQSTDWANVKFQTCPPWRISNRQAGPQIAPLICQTQSHQASHFYRYRNSKGNVRAAPPLFPLKYV